MKYYYMQWGFSRREIKLQGKALELEECKHETRAYLEPKLAEEEAKRTISGYINAPIKGEPVLVEVDTDCYEAFALCARYSDPDGNTAFFTKTVFLTLEYALKNAETDKHRGWYDDFVVPINFGQPINYEIQITIR